MNKELIELLNEYKERPVLLFGKKALKPLMNSVYGYIHCMYKRDKVYPEFLLGFQTFIEREYGLLENTISYPNRNWLDIMEFFEYTEELAFDAFYKKMEEYLKLSEQERKDLENYTKPMV